MEINRVDKIRVKCDRVGGSIGTGSREQLLFGYNPGKLPSFKMNNNPFFLQQTNNRLYIDDFFGEILTSPMSLLDMNSEINFKTEFFYTKLN